MATVERYALLIEYPSNHFSNILQNYRFHENAPYSCFFRFFSIYTFAALVQF